MGRLGIHARSVGCRCRLHPRDRDAPCGNRWRPAYGDDLGIGAMAGTQPVHRPTRDLRDGNGGAGCFQRRERLRRWKCLVKDHVGAVLPVPPLTSARRSQHCKLLSPVGERLVVVYRPTAMSTAPAPRHSLFATSASGGLTAMSLSPRHETRLRSGRMSERENRRHLSFS